MWVGKRKMKREKLPFGSSILNRSKAMFWECVFKGVAFGLLYGFRKWCSWNKPKRIPYRYEMIPKIMKRVCKKKGWNYFINPCVQQIAEILQYFLSIDSAYSTLFEEFVKEYYKEFYKK